MNATEPFSDKLIEFDGIALFLYEKPEFLAAMLRHSYYIDVVAPDEARFIDKAAVRRNNTTKQRVKNGGDSCN